MIEWFISYSDVLYDNFIKAGRASMFLKGFICTLQISLGAVGLGIFIGFVLALIRISGDEMPKGKEIRKYIAKKSFGKKVLFFLHKAVYKLAGAYIDIIRGTPVVTQLLIISGTIFASARGMNIWIGIVALGINSGAYVSEIVRAGVLSVDRGQMEAGRSLGFSKKATMFFIIIPQAIKNILPALANEFINLVKETAIVGYIAVNDITKVAQTIMSRTFQVEPLFGAAVMYFILIKVLTLLLRKLETRLRESDKR